ncbi:MAG TPA: hypothetical protein GX528_06075 [Firmicutes bacterium]|nr:hypothetical protein [Bacillota bacterium]
MFKRLIAGLLVMALLMPIAAEARLSTSHTVTMERQNKWLAVYTGAVNYALTERLHATFIIDACPKQGIDGDLGTTLYFTPGLTATLGIRRGFFKSVTPLTPYLSVTVSF